MANQLFQRPIRVDTPMGVSWRNTPNFVGLPPFIPRFVYWFDPATVGDTFQITDPVRNLVVLEGRCENAGQSQYFPLVGQFWVDFIVSTLGSGTLEIY